MPLWVSIFFVLAGLFSFAGAVFNWDWFMTHYRARLFVRVLGRNGARRRLFHWRQARSGGLSRGNLLDTAEVEGKLGVARLHLHLPAVFKD